MYGAISGIEAAAETAAKLEASLNVKKKNDSTEVPKAFFKNTDVLKIIQSEYSINHCSQAIRNLLCKGATQEKIREYCEAYVSTKGRYIPEGNTSVEKHPDKAFGLYLFIQGPNKRSIDLAIAMIENIISTGEPRPPSLMSINTAGPPPGSVMGPQLQSQPQPTMQSMPPHVIHQNFVQMQVPPPAINLLEKVQIGIDRPQPGFNLPMKLIGQNGMNLQYIKKETGAVVTLRGIGSAFIEPTTGQESQEPLHFCIEHSKPEGLATARDLVINLIATVQQDYAQTHGNQAPVQQLTMDPNILVHQQHAPLDQQVMHQPMLTTVTLPVVQTTAGFLPQQSVSAVPPPQFTHPPPPQLSLPPPGIHIPPQQGPLVPPPGPPPQQMQAPTDQGHGTQPVQQPQAFQPGQQQYLITQSGQPVQGIMTSQGFVVLNQQPQQVFLSQPPGQPPHMVHQGQFAFQASSVPSGATAPVSYQLQYVQSNLGTPQPVVSNSPISLQGQQQQQHAVVVQQNGAVHLAQQHVVGLKPGESNVSQQSLLPSGHIVQVKSVPQTVQVVQPYSSSVQYVSSPSLRQESSPAQKEPRLGKRKFTDEAEPQITQPAGMHSPQMNQPQQMPQHQNQQPHMLQQQSQSPQQNQQGQMTQLPQMVQHAHAHLQQQQLLHPQQLMQPPPQYLSQVTSPQPVPHPNQTVTSSCQPMSVRQGIGLQELMGFSNMERDEDGSKGAEPGGAGASPPPGPGNQYMGQQQPGDQQQRPLHNQWLDESGSKKGREQDPSNIEYSYNSNNSFNRRDRPARDRPTFNHYSSKPQLYGCQSYTQPGVCPPPPPPPPQQFQHQQYQFHHRR